MSDDVRGFYCKQGDPVLWGSCQGRCMDIVSFASRVLQAMRHVGTPMGRRLPDVLFQDAVEHARYELPSLRQP